MSREVQMYASMYIRRNGAWGSSCDGCLDTGHNIVEDSGRFTVFSAHDEDLVIAMNVARGDAERAIAEDWRRNSIIDGLTHKRSSE